MIIGIVPYARSASPQNEPMDLPIMPGLAIKLYQLENGRWPSNLTQLKSVGFTVDDWTTIQCGAFGYAVEEDHAWLWTYSWQDRPPRVPANRPETDSEKSAGLIPSPQLLRIQP
jgi:hypothetical protein